MSAQSIRQEVAYARHENGWIGDAAIVVDKVYAGAYTDLENFTLSKRNSRAGEFPGWAAGRPACLPR